ncbi:hypothetical protein Pd630_LPD07138 [Rhodococcus opacus PD630]|nr:hypothetical protein Pd630_LPD07138 [Rhodococcus opacus PD630]
MFNPASNFSTDPRCGACRHESEVVVKVQVLRGPSNVSLM